MKKLILSAAIALAVSTSAHAAVNVTITTGAGAFAASSAVIGNSKIITFDAANPQGITSSGLEGADIKQGSVANQWLTPAGDTSKYLRVEAIGSGNSNGVDYFNVSSGPGFDTVSFYWGSVDTHNSVRIYSTDSLYETFTGTQILALAGITTSGTTSILASFSNASGLIKKIGLISNGTAFELDNIRFSNAVPEPATWAMMITGFGMVGSGMRRGRRTKLATATA
ncbi:PEPxxWA-CTERM sorting domain-containing protein [Sphingobium boeckii]|uniref:PEP-CTERM protein-sorting domain-containing protein n=1 Tax=Sphingobium boeckii TaxID=1082345 RepID=A0A7W9EE09_9SPHN|nr:PEPxxWA-CTERM sorting domain-containing protein [Sphingobium boeckii]MBB5685489.1 hypothetical protein [Sphingobium boeckii]